jgi:hypothetical protein
LAASVAQVFLKGTLDFIGDFVGLVTFFGGDKNLLELN